MFLWLKGYHGNWYNNKNRNISRNLLSKKWEPAASVWPCINYITAIFILSLSSRETTTLILWHLQMKVQACKCPSVSTHILEILLWTRLFMVWFTEDTCEGFSQFYCTILPEERVATDFWSWVPVALHMFSHLYFLVPVTERNSSNITLKNADYSKIKRSQNPRIQS